MVGDCWSDRSWTVLFRRIHTTIIRSINNSIASIRLLLPLQNVNSLPRISLPWTAELNSIAVRVLLISHCPLLLGGTMTLLSFSNYALYCDSWRDVIILELDLVYSVILPITRNKKNKRSKAPVKQKCTNFQFRKYWNVYLKKIVNYHSELLHKILDSIFIEFF